MRRFWQLHWGPCLQLQGSWGSADAPVQHLSQSWSIPALQALGTSCCSQEHQDPRQGWSARATLH